MSDAQSLLSSSVAPGDSVSSRGGKKKPGKAERAQRRSQVGAPSGRLAAPSKAAAFASGFEEVRPQIGRFPVVFQTGAGEPSRDATFAIDPVNVSSVLSGFAGRFTTNPKYAQFKAHSEIDDDDFQKNLVMSALLGLSQQVVHAHVNMGLPQGDFAPVASTDVRVPSSVSAFIRQFGEFSVPSTGTRFLLSGYEDTVKWLVHSAEQVGMYGPNGVLRRSWLPMSPRDKRTRTIIAGRLNDFIGPGGISINPVSLEDGILSGDVPDVWENIKEFLGSEPAAGERDERDRFDFLFKAYSDTGQFFSAFSSAHALPVLQELNLSWSSPSAGHLNWQYNAKEAFTRWAESWARLSAAYAQFFEMSSGLTTRSTAAGSQSQMARVNSVEGVTVVRTHLALSAPEFSLVACFPATCVFTSELSRLVVLTTPLSVSQRATEFCQLDWR